MKKIFNLLIATFIVFPQIVLAADLGAGPNICDISNPYYDGDVLVDGWHSKDKSSTIYDIVNVDLVNDTLYLYGWVFDKAISTYLVDGGNATVEFILRSSKGEEIPFEVTYATPDHGGCMGNGCNGGGGEPKYYDLTYWQCTRSSRGTASVINGTSYTTGGYCLKDLAILQGGFRAALNLKDPRIKPDTTYTVYMNFDHSELPPSEEIMVAAAKAVVFDRVRNYTGTDNMKINVGGFKDTASVVVNHGRPVGKNGLYCSSQISLDEGLSAGSSTHYSKTHGFYIEDIRGNTQFACRGGKDRCPSNGSNGPGTIRLYKLYYNKAKGSNKATPTSGPEGTYAFAPASWLKFDGNITIKTTGEALKEAKCNEDEDGPYYNYYMFLGSKESKFINAGAVTQHTTAENSQFNDTKIFEELVKKLNPDKNFSLDYIRVLDDASGVVDINNKNYGEFYDILKKVRDESNKYIQTGNDFYITHTKWCTIDSSGTHCYDTGKLDKELSYYMNRSIYTNTLDISPNKTSSGYTFELYRTWNKGMTNQSFMSSTPVRATDIIYHPAEYRLAYCVTKKEEIDCKDTVNQAVCLPNDSGTDVVFHENDNLQTCTIPKDNNSGFTAIEKDETKDPYSTQEGYCEVACKEDLDIKLPGTKFTAAGQYFLLDNYVPEIKATRTCVTTKIDYDKFNKDLENFEANLPGKYNKWRDMLEIYLHFRDGDKGTSDKIDNNSEGLYTTEEKTCEIICADDDEECKKNRLEKKYNVIHYSIGGVKYDYHPAVPECGIDKEGQPYIDQYKENNNIHKWWYDKENKIRYEEEKENSMPSSWYDTVEEVTPNASEFINEELEEDHDEAIKIDEAHKNKSGNSSGIGYSKSGSDTCYYECGTEKNPETCDADYDWESWVIYSYTPINSGSTGITFKSEEGYWEEGTACSGNDGEKYDEAIERLIGTYGWNTDSAYQLYQNDFNRYLNTVNGYNKCFNWSNPTDGANRKNYDSKDPKNPPKIVKVHGSYYYDYYYKFMPDVSFDYGLNGPGKELNRNVFPVKYDYTYPREDWTKQEVTGNGYGTGSYPVTKTSYWDKNAEANKTYDNENKSNSGPAAEGLNKTYRTLLSCEGDTCEPSKNTISFEFYNSSYIRRDETVTYQYHLPRVFTYVPNGDVTIKPDKNNTYIELDPEAVPVNINTLEGQYEYKLTISNLKDELRSDKYTKNRDDDLEERFKGSTGNGALTDGSDYICNYEVKNDIYKPAESRLNFFYRTVDPININPVPRELGYNWMTDKADQVKINMAEAENDYQILTEGRDKFQFTLTPTIMKQIRNYNKTQSKNDRGYADWDLKCYDYEDSREGYHCYSNFLTCLASGEENRNESGQVACETIFENTLKDYSSYSKGYDLDELDYNRRTLISKQNALDGR